jgi:formylglycine-generating enzyme required for sulfatase activity
LSDEEKETRAAQVLLEGRGESRPLAALEAVVQERRLALLGDPGGGKSTFVRHLLDWLAAHHLGQARQAPPEELGALLPVLVILRDLAPGLRQLELEALPEDRRRSALAHLVRDHLLQGLERLDAAAFGEGLAEALSGGRCFVAFDGLDEVSEALRPWARRAIQAAMGHYALRRVVVTCRVRSYSGAAVLPDFKSHTLAPFDEGKVRDFALAWYRAQRELGRVDAVQAGEKADDLGRAALTDDLRELSSNPMLLTTMAIIHQREVGLPRERVRLYDLAVEVLSSRWQRRKVGRDAPGLAPGLAALLGDARRLRRIVERLAYHAHEAPASVGDEGAADLGRGEALTLLEAPDCLGEAGLAAHFLDYVDRRAGLLVGRGGGEGRPGVYSFPHRTFQEYLAGCHVVGQRDVVRELWRRAREGDDWALAVQLGAEELLYNRRNDFGLLDLAYRLCPAAEADEAHAWRAALWSGRMAALLGQAFVAADEGAPDGGPAYLERLLARLVRLVQGGRLGAYERAEAGRVLAVLGDPRPEVLRPEVMAFCRVPAGPFLMGSSDEDEMAEDREKPLHRVEIPYNYWPARYPVTNAQFRAFVEAGGYQERRYWREAEAVGCWQDGQVKRRFVGRLDEKDGLGWIEEQAETPYDFGEPFNLPNHPVVGVTWYEALAFTYWLTERLCESANQRVGEAAGGAEREMWEGLTAGRLVVRLPSEAEWEKGGRGGAQGGARRYPWGDEPDPERANYYDTGIGSTSAVGCFPGGASPYGCLDMAGNVWEWTSSLWGEDVMKPEFKYPYDPTDGRENLEAGDHVCRVLRGGAFYDGEWFSRCALRNWSGPDFRLRLFGFRVVAAPSPPSPPSGPSALGNSGTSALRREA